MQLQLPLPELAQLTGGAPPTSSHRIFSNRNLRLDQIDWVGFDMDYTLAVYHQQEMDRLSIEATIQKLIARGYPDALRYMPYRTDFPVRGLLVDRKLGNILKMDRYKYVKRAYHGMQQLSKDERRKTYNTHRLDPATDRYHWVDTLYALPEVTVFAAAVEHLEQVLGQCDYDKLFNDVRECIDQSHQDGSILDHILGDLPRYVWRDPKLATTLHQLRSSGKKLFVLTNSHAPYTERMMSYLLDDTHPQYSSWRGYFDIVVTASRKPRFFTHEDPFMEVLGDGEKKEVASLERGKIYAGGHLEILQTFMDTTPDRVLYVGDHIFGDVLRAKKRTAWRTMMIVQEMGEELVAHDSLSNSLHRLDMLEELRFRLTDDLRDMQRSLRSLQRRKDGGESLSPTQEAERVRQRRAVDRLKARVRATKREYDHLEIGVDHRFHPHWGSLFKAGPETSSFGHQIEIYAGLYTARVSNLSYYSPMHYFQSPRDRLPHEMR